MDYNKCAKEVFGDMRTLGKHVAIKKMQNVSNGEMAILAYLLLEHDGASAGELSSVSCVVSSRIAAVLNSLEKKGFARRESDPSDRRKVLVYITEDGKSAVLQEYNNVIVCVERALRVLGQEDTVALQRILKKLIEKEEKSENIGE